MRLLKSSPCLLWSFLPFFSGVHPQRSGKCSTWTRNGLCEWSPWGSPASPTVGCEQICRDWNGVKETVISHWDCRIFESFNLLCRVFSPEWVKCKSLLLVLTVSQAEFGFTVLLPENLFAFYSVLVYLGTYSGTFTFSGFTSAPVCLLFALHLFVRMYFHCVL